MLLLAVRSLLPDVGWCITRARCSWTVTLLLFTTTHTLTDPLPHHSPPTLSATVVIIPPCLHAPPLCPSMTCCQPFPLHHLYYTHLPWDPTWVGTVGWWFDLVCLCLTFYTHLHTTFLYLPLHMPTHVCVTFDPHVCLLPDFDLVVTVWLVGLAVGWRFHSLYYHLLLPCLPALLWLCCILVGLHTVPMPYLLLIIVHHTHTAHLVLHFHHLTTLYAVCCSLHVCELPHTFYNYLPTYYTHPTHHTCHLPPLPLPFYSAPLLLLPYLPIPPLFRGRPRHVRGDGRHARDCSPYRSAHCCAAAGLTISASLVRRAACISTFVPDRCCLHMPRHCNVACGGATRGCLYIILQPHTSRAPVTALTP